ncbi:MAG: hypothetical protein DRR16_32525 [Candidatus Parabeggiatoa sp. nov. 3]|jgi:hypothetical protein|nr:MAG: hypothetical protein DRR16_32525 [Gammaproteobacteria bacterium]
MVLSLNVTNKTVRDNSFAANELGIAFPMNYYRFWKLYFFCAKYFYLPVIFPIVIVALCELYTSLFDSMWARFTVKFFSAFFLMCIMIAMSLPILGFIWGGDNIM